LKKIFITAPQKIINQLEKKFRHNFEIEFEYSDSLEGKIEVIKNNRWVTICRFSSNESLDNIVTMFNVNYEIHNASNKVNT
jgi:hypothetical protein